MVRTAYASTYPPRRCGIATFTSDLSSAIGSREIVALHAPDLEAVSYPAEVHHRIRRDELADYISTARSLDHCADIVSIQHEHGIWGGLSGRYVVDFAQALRIPSVATLHTVLRHPTAAQKDAVVGLVSTADATIVMSQSAAKLLKSAYGLGGAPIEIIPHGVPDVPLVDPQTLKPALGLVGRPIILSFGLIGPGKGLELVLDALPAVVAAHPTVCYVIAGATHPDLLRREGE
ncbi:MAG: glycosyltransferase, partial [Chloroflexota bacterium]